MQTPTRGDMNRQFTLGEQVSARERARPAVRPTADAELEEVFLRAAAAWARWRDRSVWEGR